MLLFTFGVIIIIASLLILSINNPKMVLFIIVLVTLLICDRVYAATPLERCVTKNVVDVTTLPGSASKMWHDVDTSPRMDHTLRSVVWFQLPKGSVINLYSIYIDKTGIEWAWGSAAEIPGYDRSTIVSGWVKYSFLACGGLT